MLSTLSCIKLTNFWYKKRERKKLMFVLIKIKLDSFRLPIICATCHEVLVVHDVLVVHVALLFGLCSGHLGMPDRQTDMKKLAGYRNSRCWSDMAIYMHGRVNVHLGVLGLLPLVLVPS